MKSKIFPKSAKPAIFGIGESIKHKFRVLQVYLFQNWYQSNTTYVNRFTHKAYIQQQTYCTFTVYINLIEGSRIHPFKRLHIFHSANLNNQIVTWVLGNVEVIIRLIIVVRNQKTVRPTFVRFL